MTPLAPTSPATRRQFLAAGGVGAASLLLAACGGSDGGSSPSGSAGAKAGAKPKGNITFTTWGTDAEIKSFRTSIAGFEKANPGTKVTLRELPFEEIKQNIDAGLEADKAPDVFRVTYQDVGFYSTRNALLGIGDYLPANFGDAFIPGLWAVVQNDGEPVGVPLHTDVSALVYNKELLRKAGVTSIPTSLDDAWSWEEFLDASRKVKAANPGKFGHAFNWQQAGSYRWMNWLYQAGGSMIDADAKKATLVSAEGTKTLEFFKTWTDEGLIPPATSPKSTGYPDEIFPAQTFGLLFAGDFLLASLADTVKKFDFGAMPLPRDKAAATDLGGNALVATAGSKNPTTAAAFLQYMVSETEMKRFCVNAGTLPTRPSLSQQTLDYQVTPELFPIFTQQATTLSEGIVKASSLPNFTAINQVFTDELESFVRGKQATAQTLQNMNDGVQKNLS